jgi:hypothetical protein
VCEEKKPFKRFSWARSRFTALKRGVNEMISTEQDKVLPMADKLREVLSLSQKFGWSNGY